MSFEAIKVVISAESDAENLRIDALAEAKRIVAAAEASGKEEVQKALKSAELQVQTICMKAEDQGKESSAKHAEEVRTKCLHMEKEAEKRMNQAVALIMGRVVGGQ